MGTAGFVIVRSTAGHSSDWSGSHARNLRETRLLPMTGQRQPWSDASRPTRIHTQARQRFTAPLVGLDLAHVLAQRLARDPEIVSDMRDRTARGS
jgi:hypothetical protein